MSGKLGWCGAYNRSRTLSPIITSNSRDEEMDNPSHTRYERELKTLRAENTRLKGEYDELNTTLKQLFSETSHEKFDERRINLLKQQIIQLERQVAILNESLSCRHEATMEVENTMAWLADKLRSYISANVKGPMVPIARVDLMSLVESSESARIKLFKTVEGSGKQSVGKDLLLLNPFLCGKYKDQKVSLLEICLNRLNYVNFRHVACLESKLCTLYKELIRVFEQLEYITKSPVGIRQGDNAESSRLKTTILRACMIIRDAADDLLALSLLCPSTPWPALKRPLTKQIPVDRITSALPNGLPRLKEEEIIHLIEASIGACNHRYLLLEKEKIVLKEELTFHRATHDLQVQYTKDLFEAVKKGYGEFESSAKETIAKPIKTLLDAYRKLKDSASEQAFRDFLVVIKENEEQLSSVEEMLLGHDFETEDTGAVAFSKFGLEFLSKLDALAEQCKKERDQAIAARKDVTEEQLLKDAELQQMIEDLERKYEKQWNPIKTSVTTTENSPLNIIQTESSYSADEKNKTNSQDSSSRCYSAKSLKDDPTVLRSFLYPEVTDNSNTAYKGDCSISRNQTHDPQDTKSLKSSLKEERKMVKKGTKWKPEKEWVSDFSVEDSDAIHAKPVDLAHKYKKVKNNESKDWNSDFQQLSLEIDSIKSINTSEPKRALQLEGDFCTAKDSAHSSLMPKVKKPLTYEPRLYVANRTLKLRRAGSLPSTVYLNQAVCDKNDSGTVEADEVKNISEVHLKAVNPKDLQQKSSSHKRNSWR